MQAKAILMLGAALLGAAWASPSGAPVAACDTLTPQHGAESQTGPNPYQLIAQNIAPNVYNCKI